MKLQRLRIEQLRQFRGTLEIADFSPGINLFSGPNESGKSTVVRAIRAAFFEKYRSNSVSDLQPWGDTSSAPQVELDFAHNDQAWRLVKRFLQRKRCDLTVAGEAFSGEDAEEKLANLLGFQYPGKGASKEEHWGIPGLLWIEQGRGQEVETAVRNAGSHLKTALGAKLGEIASSSGDDIIRDVEQQRGVYLTKTGLPTGEYKASQHQLDELKQVLHALDKEIAHYQSQVDRLGELGQQHARDESERPWERFRQEQQQAQQQFDQVSQLSEQQAIDDKALGDVRKHIELLRGSLKELEEKTSQLKDREQAQIQAQDKLTQLQAQQTQIDARLEQSRSAYKAARDLERQARQQAQRESLMSEQRQQAILHEKLVSSRDQASKFHRELLEYQHQLASCRIEVADLEKLRKLDADLKASHIRQQSVATRLKFQIDPGQSLQMDGESITESCEKLLLQQAELTLPGVGGVQIIPGGKDLGDLARELEQTQEQLDALLKQMQVASLAEAEQRADTFNRLNATIASHQQLLNSHAPQGIDALEAELKTGQQRLQHLEKQLADLPELPVQDIPTPSQAEQRLESADQALKAAEAAEQKYLRELATARQQEKSASEEYQRLKAIVTDPKQAQREQAVSEQLVDARAQETTLKTKIDEAKQRIDAARPDILKQDIQRLGSSANQAENLFSARKDDLMRLETALSTLGAQGLEEDRAKRMSELEALARRHDELKRRAEATDLLLTLLKEKRQVLTRQLQAPLQKHLNHYLQLLFPQASLEVDEDLMPGRLRRPDSHGHEDGDFEALSFGAREQMGLISRLAYADLLKEVGKPTLLILDDALVHSDVERLAQMKRILFDASQRHQVLLFTCHPEKWNDLGAPVRELASLL